MTHVKTVFFVLNIISITTLGKEFLYPIEQLNEQTILLMHQRSIDDIELLVWNPTQQTTSKELTSLYLPSSVQLLPSKTAYSFIDRGRIRIKNFQKRTPKTIDIYEPITEIQSLSWISDEQCVFVAKYHDMHKIFMYDTAYQNGTLFCVSNIHDTMAYIAPCKINSTLFCLQQIEHGLYALVSMPWNPITYESMKSEQTVSVNNPTILLKHELSLCFLSMIDQSHGFVLELISKDIDTKKFTFGCCQLSQENDAWQIQRLFQFVIPEDLIVGYLPDRLHESIYPLLPRYTQDTIYFTDYDQSTKTCQVYGYDLSSKTITPCALAVRNMSLEPQEYTFAPLITKGHIYLGCSYQNSDQHRKILDINEFNGNITCQLPTISKS